MSEKRYYVAYGSNLNVAQMRWRCPEARAVGTAELEGWELLFRGSKTGSYLTIERSEGGRVPVAVWEVTERDEDALDRYEGYPAFYYKREIKLTYTGCRTGRRRTVSAFVYVMREDRPLGVPSAGYMRTCLEGYDAFRFDRDALLGAYFRSREVCGDEG